MANSDTKSPLVDFYTRTSGSAPDDTERFVNRHEPLDNLYDALSMLRSDNTTNRRLMCPVFDNPKHIRVERVGGAYDMEVIGTRRYIVTDRLTAELTKRWYVERVPYLGYVIDGEYRLSDAGREKMQELLDERIGTCMKLLNRRRTWSTFEYAGTLWCNDEHKPHYLETGLLFANERSRTVVIVFADEEIMPFPEY